MPEVAGGVTEDRVSDKAFELVFAFDEVITTGGYRESINLQQIKTNVEMDSHEEKLALMIKQSKMDSAKDQAARQARAIKERQRELVSRGGGDALGSMVSARTSTRGQMHACIHSLTHCIRCMPHAGAGPPGLTWGPGRVPGHWRRWRQRLRGRRL